MRDTARRMLLAFLVYFSGWHPVTAQEAANQPAHELRDASAPRAATQKLVTDPGGVEVLVDGALRGTTDAQSGALVLRLPFGERSFTLRRRGYELVRFAVVYEHQRTGEIFVAMKALHAEPQPGSLLLEDVLDRLDGDLPLEQIAALVRKKGVGLDLAGEAEQRRLTAGSGKALERRRRLAVLLVEGTARDIVRGDYASAIRALEFAARLSPADLAVRRALERTRRARETELEVLSMR